MSNVGRDRSDFASKDQREATTGETAGGVTRQEIPSMLGSAVAAYGKGAIQRKIAERAAKRSAAPSEGAPSGGGSPLPAPLQAKMEGSFGADFSDVRVHQGGEAEQLGARAFARGSDLHFAPGQYDPSSAGGQALIGHELTHVVQQRAGRVATQGKDGPINNDPGLEGEADQMGARAARGELAHVSGSSAGLQRKGADSPIQCDGVNVTKLSKLTKGGLARKNLEETNVSGPDEHGADRSSARSDALAAALSKGAFQATADMLAGPSFDSQPAFQQAFVASWTSINPAYDAKGAQGAALLDPILTAKFKGNKLGYLQDLREHGHSSPTWQVLMCLGEIEGGMASDDAVVRAFERAAEQLDNAKFQVFWTRVEAPLRKSMHHILTSDRRLHRVLAAKNMKVAEAPVVDAEENLQKAEHAEDQADKAKTKTEAALQVKVTELGTKQTQETQKDQELVTAKDQQRDAEKSVKRETKRVAKNRRDADTSDDELSAKQTQLDADTRALAEANQALAEATQAFEEATRRLKRREQRLGAVKLAAASTSDGPAKDEETVAAKDEETVAPKESETAPKDESAEIERLARRAERARQRAMAAKQSTIEAQAHIEKVDAELAKSKDSVALAKSVQEQAHDNLHRHEVELKARQAKLEQAKQNVATAKKNAEDAKAEAEKTENAVKALKSQLATDETTLGKARKDVKKAKSALRERKAEQVAGGTEVAYLAALIESTASKLNDFDREAIDELHEWASEHKQAIAQAMKPGSLFLAALDKHIKKARNREIFKAIIKGDTSDAVKQALAGKGHADAGLGFQKQETEGALDQVTMTALVVDREAQKHQDKKIQIRTGPAKIEHTVLKQQLLSMSPDAREQYLAFSTGTSKADLQDDTKRNKALTTLDAKLENECGVVDAKERERMLALFKVAGAGVNYSKLYGLVHTTDSKKYATDDDFGKKALAYIADFRDGEFHQLRQDKEILAAIKVCKKKDDINRIVGGLDVSGDITPLTATKADADKATTEALHRPEHWSTLINVEMDKWRVSVRDERSRNDVYLFGHRAQMAALEVAKLKNPADQNAGKPAHADAKKFVQDVWAGVSGGAQNDMKSQYPDLAKALKNGGEVTLEMVLDSIAKFHIGSWKFHVDKDDIKKTIETSNGKELLDKWSNIEEFKTAKASVPDPVKQRELARTFVLDVNAEKRTWLDQAVGGEGLKYANILRDRFKKAAESDAEFKSGLTAAGYDNTQFNRENMEFRGLLEKANKQRRGLDFDGFSSKGHVQHQAHREFVGGLRHANKDDQDLNAQKDGQGGKHDQDIDKDRDEHFEEHHAKGLDEKKEELEISGEEFDKLRENVKKYTQIAIALIISIAVSAATMGTVPAWAIVLVKVGAIILADIIKEVVGNAITGDKLNAQRLVTNIAIDSIGAAAGGYAGMGFEQHAGEMNVFLKEFIKGTVVSVTKTFTKDSIKAISERNAGDITVSGAIKNQIMGFVVSAASSQISAAAMEAKGLSEHEHTKETHEHSAEAADKQREHLEADSKPEAEHGVEEAQHEADEAQHGVDETQDLVDSDHTTVETDHGNVDTDTSQLVAANSEVAAAQHELELAQQSADQDQIELAQTHLEAAQMHVEHAQEALETDQERLEADEHQLEGDEETLEQDKEALESANEHLEHAKEELEGIEKQIEELEAKGEAEEAVVKAEEAKIQKIEVMGKKIDDAADKLLDVPADIIMETIGERHERKLEKVTPKTRPVDVKALVQHAPQHGPQPVAQHGAHHGAHHRAHHGKK